MSDNRDVTVVISCFNYGRYVGDAVASALGQEGGPPQVIVVDDGSDDPATLDVLDRLPVGVEVLHQENAGPSAARNAGAAAARTPLLMVLDADDRLCPDAVRNLRPLLEADPELAYAYGLIAQIGDWSGVIRFPDYDPFKLLYRPIVGTTWLMRSSAFEQVGGYDPDVTWAEDWDILLRLLEHDRHGRRVPEVAYEYRRHGTSKLGNDRGAYRRQYRAMRKRHAPLYARAGKLAEQSGLGPVGRLTYRVFWAWRPVPRLIENVLYRLIFRRSARSTASSTSSASRAVSRA